MLFLLSIAVLIYAFGTFILSFFWGGGAGREAGAGGEVNE